MPSALGPVYDITTIRKGYKRRSFYPRKALFRHASVSRTYPCKLVGQLVSWSVTLSDFQSLVSNGCSNQKIQKTKSIFSNFASGRTLPTQSTGPQPIQLV